MSSGHFCFNRFRLTIWFTQFDRIVLQFNLLPDRLFLWNEYKTNRRADLNFSACAG